MKATALLLLTATLIAATLLISAPGIHAAVPSQLQYRILETREHDKRLFTQGLIKTERGFLESSGLYRRSKLVAYDFIPGMEKSQLQKHHKLPRKYFAEGLTLFDNKLYLLTWKAGRCLVFDADSFDLLTVHRYQGEGWGLTHDGQHLIMSDGSHRLSFRRPSDFSLVKTLEVHSDDGPWTKLNELEFINGEIWANTWQDSRIVTINPESGRVTGILNLDELVQRHGKLRPDRVLNGIAYDAEKKAVWVTGKYWPRLYLIEVSSQETVSPF